jgi:hydroxypyruvate reductase
MAKPRLIVAPGLPKAVFESLPDRFDAVGGQSSLSVEEALAAAVSHEAEAFLVSHHHKMTADAIARLPPSVRILATVTVGYDHIDLPAAKAKGLIVTNTPDVLTDCTADMAMLLMLAACRRGSEAEQLMRKGWRQSFGMGDFLGLKVTGKRLGIFGMGRIGQAMAQRARGFNMQILYSNRSRLSPELENGARYFADLKEMLPLCDIVAIHAPATKDTDKVINAELLALLPKGAVLVNTSRGSLIDEDALIEALKSGHLFAAGLDVFRSEPAFDLRLAELPNVFLTPHIGSATVETRNAMGFRALDNIAAVCSGLPAIDPL